MILEVGVDRHGRVACNDFNLFGTTERFKDFGKLNLVKICNS